MIDKTVADVETAVAPVLDGATVLIGGFGRAGQPVELIDALITQRASDLTIMSSNAGNGDTSPGGIPTGAAGAIPAVGGAMDLAIGAKSVYVITDLLTKTAESKLVDVCTDPLTGIGCVTRVYTDHAIFDITADGFVVQEKFGDNTIASLSELTGLTLSRGA